ncbi:uncharacterized protein LOC125945354 [Dermacentor silvarum]|uniref:uncharacterized protein LOC125945354 n=1 Tax=Dermacentor silvarum TaxID=543639 RepID=UPI0021013884|nr:uncharacterized protein LOC125945354 [Dermacentor silvarum]
MGKEAAAAGRQPPPPGVVGGKQLLREGFQKPTTSVGLADRPNGRPAGRQAGPVANRTPTCYFCRATVVSGVLFRLPEEGLRRLRETNRRPLQSAGSVTNLPAQATTLTKAN